MKIQPTHVFAVILTFCVAHAAASAPARNAAPTSQAQAEADMGVARRYFDAMVANDHAAQAKMLTDDAVFEDPIMIVGGRAAIESSWKRQQIRFLSFHEQSAFHSGRGTVVFAGTARFEQTFRTQTGQPLILNFDVPTFVALTVRGRQIGRHIDYVDTGAFAAQLQAQIKRLGER